MIYLIFLALTLVLFGGFFALTMVEARTGTRMLSGPRSKFDKQVGKLFFIASHVDWWDFIAHLVQGISARIVHDIAHWTLMAVRFMERELTRIVRYLRDRRPNLLAPKPSRKSPLAQTADYFRGLLHLTDSKKK